MAMGDVSDQPWSGITRSAYPSAEAYCAACIIDLNPPGSAKTKARCKLPVYEPPHMGGRLNRRAVHAAAERLLAARHGVEVSPDAKAAAAGRLLGLYTALGERPPPRLVDLAGVRGAELTR